MRDRTSMPRSPLPPGPAGPQVGTVSLATNGGARLTVTNEPVLRIDLLGDAGIWHGERRLRFPTHRAELAVCCLALAAPGGLHQEVLVERLWPSAPADRGAARLRTLLWQVRRTLGADAWRIQRRAQRVVLELEGASVDVVQARDTAEALLVAPRQDLEALRAAAKTLSLPILVGWCFEPWVEAEQARNAELVLILDRRVAQAP